MLYELTLIAILRLALCFTDLFFTSFESVFIETSGKSNSNNIIIYVTLADETFCSSGNTLQSFYFLFFNKNAQGPPLFNVFIYKKCWQTFQP